MKYLKLYENFRWNGDIMRISRGSNWMDANLSKDPVEINIVNKILSNINHKHEYIINSSGGWNNNLIITFDEPKIFDKMKFNMHEYSPAEIRYFLRIYQFQYYWGEDEDIYVVQWISRLFATKEHIVKYHNKYPHIGGYPEQKLVDDGIDYWNKEEEKWKPLYRPPFYKNKTSLFQHGDAKSETYICRDLFALFDLLDDFQDFLSDKSEDYFKTDYPSF